MNNRYRSHGWPGLEDWLIVSAVHAGNPMGIDRVGRVWVSDHGAGGVYQVAESFEDVLRTRCLRLPRAAG